MSKLVQCRFCGRVRLHEEWVRDSSVKVDVIGFCALCGRLDKDKAERAWKREGRELLRRRERGYGPPAEGEDVFAGFKGDER